MIEQGMTITAGYLADHFFKQWNYKTRTNLFARVLILCY